METQRNPPTQKLFAFSDEKSNKILEKVSPTQSFSDVPSETKQVVAAEESKSSGKLLLLAASSSFFKIHHMF